MSAQRHRGRGEAPCPCGHARCIVGDEGGSLMVVEALLAGMIILTAMLFLTNVTKPSPPGAESGLDLEGVARDVLVVLENRPPTQSGEHCPDDPPAVDCFDSRLEEMASDALGLGHGSFGVADATARDAANGDAERFLQQIIPVGNRWLLRLDNGVEPLVLLPSSGSNVQLTPRAAKAAETFVVPPWQENAATCGPPPAAATLSPGGLEGALDVSTGTLLSPTGDVPPAGHTTWAAWWTAQQAAQVVVGVTDGADRIPPSALYGWWRYDGTCHFVGLPEGTATDHPVYGIQLVVWPIAG